MATRSVASAPVPLQLDLDYVDSASDACFAWLKGRYANLQPATSPVGTTSHADTEEPVTGAETTSKKKPQLTHATLQRLENDIAACDALRWRVFAFPSHPTQPLQSSYRNEAAKKGGQLALAAQLHKTKKSTKANTNDAAEEVAATETAEQTAPAEASRYALIIRTRANEDAKKREKTKKAKSTADAPASRAVPPARLEERIERLVREDEHARLCQLLGEERVPFGGPLDAPRVTPLSRDGSASPPSWWRRWMPLAWRPLLGGYVSAPTRTDSARFLVFPQAAHPPVDFRDSTAPQPLAGTSPFQLAAPQRVPYFVRGSATLDAEKSNPAAGCAGLASPDAAASGGTAGTGSAAAAAAPLCSSSATHPGLQYSVHYATTIDAPSAAAAATAVPKNWADTVEVSVAAQQSRTERMYAPAREKVQRVTLVEDSTMVRVSQGNPRWSTALTVAHATVPNSGVKHQHESTVGESSEDSKRGKKHKKEKKEQRKEASTVVQDDSVDLLQLQDGYDSSVQYFGLPRFWQRLVQPSLRDTAASGDTDSSLVSGTKALDAVPRGQYRVRLSGGPGLELARLGTPSSSGIASPSEAIYTVFGRLWTESWLEVPLPWRMALRLRTQSAVTMPLDTSATVWPPMVGGTAPSAHDASAGAAAAVSTREESGGGPSVSSMKEHPYFWATQGPRWDASLVRGFKNDYSNMHHARRWYSLLSAEVTLNAHSGKSSGKPAAVDDSAVQDGDDPSSPSTSTSTPTAGRWKNTSLTAFANACMVDTLRDYPRASVGFSFTSKIPRVSITAFNEIIPHKFECSFSWFAAFKPTATAGGGGEGSIGPSSEMGPPPAADGRGFHVDFVSGLQPPQHAAAAGRAEDGMPLLRVSPVETFQHMKCGLTWKFDE